MRRETEGLLMDAQDQDLPTKIYQVKIMEEQGTGMCRKCGHGIEIVMYRLSECEKLAQIDYKTRHDRVATIIRNFVNFTVLTPAKNGTTTMQNQS